MRMICLREIKRISSLVDVEVKLRRRKAGERKNESK